jgi:methylglutamate dehydrogenase subunit D
VVKVSAARYALRRSPFEGHTLGDRPTRAGRVEVQLAAGMLDSVTLVSTWPAGLTALTEVLGAALGLSLPAQTGQTVHTPGMLVVRTGPEEFMVIADQAGGTSADPVNMCTLLRQSIGPEIGSVTDLSHARCRIHIQGSKCLATLSKLFALDFRDEAFPLNQVRLSGHHHVPCTLHRLGKAEFAVLVFTTYAFDQLATLLDAAREFGVSLKQTG